MVKEQISLYFREGNSDKEYHVQLVSTGDLFTVNFQYGRRHSTLSGGTKTAVPVTYEQAHKTYDKLVKDKHGKGHSEGSSDTPYDGTPPSPHLPRPIPQLLPPIY